MGIKDLIKGIGKGQKRRNEMIKELDEQVRINKLIEDRQLSANERELNRFNHEEREEQIKVSLNIARKIRDEDIKFGHNPLDTKNIMKAEWEILKEKNQFAGRSNMFANRDMIHKSNNKLLHNGNILNNNGNILSPEGGFTI